MSEPVQPVPPPPVLPKPPGYRDPNATPPVRPGPPKPLKHTPILPSSVYDYDHKKRRGKRVTCCSCCCCLCLSLFIQLLVLATLFCFFYLWFSPKFPVFHLRSLRVTKLTVIPATKDGVSHVNAHASSVIEVRNPNNSKLLIYYGHSDIDVRLTAGGKEVRFSEKMVEGFWQSKGNVTRLKVENTVKDAVVGGTLRDKLKKKEVTVEVTVNTNVGVEFWGLKVGKVGVSSHCGGGGLKLKDIEGGGVMPKCTINTLKWIIIH